MTGWLLAILLVLAVVLMLAVMLIFGVLIAVGTRTYGDESESVEWAPHRPFWR